MRNLFRAGICLFLAVSSAALHAQCYPGNEKGQKKITVYLFDNIGFNQTKSQITVQFDNGAKAKFNLDTGTTQQTRKISLPVCDQYSYTITGETIFYRYVEGEFTSVKVPTQSGSRTISVLDGDRLIVTGELYDFRASDYKVFLQLDAHRPL